MFVKTRRRDTRSLLCFYEQSRRDGDARKKQRGEPDFTALLLEVLVTATVAARWFFGLLAGFSVNDRTPIAVP